MAEENLPKVANTPAPAPKPEAKPAPKVEAKPTPPPQPDQKPQLEASFVTPPPAPKPQAKPEKPLVAGQVVSGVKVVDPIAAMETAKKDIPQRGQSSRAKTPMGEVAQKIRDAFSGDKSVTVETRPDHPRGAAVVILRAPDVTRPRAYVNSSDGNWATKGLMLNLYGFLNSGEATAIQEKVLGALGIGDRQVAIFNRF